MSAIAPRPAIVTDFSLVTGLSQSRTPLQRRISAMAGMYADQGAAQRLAQEDVLVYEFFDMGVPDSPGEVAYGTSITYPGKVGDEYFMTKGHFHSVLDTAEIYYCLRGRGLLMMENPEGDVQWEELTPGKGVYVPGRYAHRSINTSPDEPLITFFAFPGHAGHDYGTIESKGFRKIVVERDGAPLVVDNPQWAQ
ncbi:glucose-6-phosphate isomerase [Wenjunlia tyrosinilytica]|uniref:glucose-6-phosphate isomerase n=1 Tax=Wenjunlia tyrosinilytica TaxID=1544741 RepID=A0A917ZT23_9ACTN|nr:glucose-6-phosphate isomerase [Wenjunlia tyrosinilytica]GGO91925.1 glucose-6-phosphate isomerase [Wenjunlia tyrosinilytica]